jgi:hypothetical protein
MLFAAARARTVSSEAMFAPNVRAPPIDPMPVFVKRVTSVPGAVDGDAY